MKVTIELPTRQLLEYLDWMGITGSKKDKIRLLKDPRFLRHMTYDMKNQMFTFYESDGFDVGEELSRKVNLEKFNLKHGDVG